MATIKAFTDLEQSRKLAEILPPENADMKWYFWKSEIDAPKTPTFGYSKTAAECYKDTEAIYLPCWSLAALLNLLPNEISTGERYCDKYQIDIRKYDGGDNTTLYQIAYGNNRGLSGSWHDMINTSEKESAIDTCYEMIILLNELKML